jgi:transcription-repair coupling factor (superfamily II helicase)
LGRGDITFRRKAAPAKKSKKAEFFQPKVGEYVVHNVHGIGVCEGLKRMKLGESERDFVVVRYDGNDKLYVAAESINLLSAYAGEEEPRLNKIGGAEFARVKEKVKAAIKKMAFDLRELYGKRENAEGHKYGPDNGALSEFEADFPYEETADQLTAVSECLNDLNRGKIMDRLLCGDVGYGKTEVAMRVAYRAVLEGKQAAFISPTTILARQHYRTLTKRMEKFGVVVRSLTRFDTPADVAKTLADLSAGKADIICGTHRVLSKDVAFKDLGLLVLDEEQRFGVADKEKIKLLKTDVNVLSLSATPIPRTLHMAMSGIRDISLLTIPPEGRIPVSTYVAEYTDSLVFDAVMREKGRGGKTFIVYNRV